MSDMQKHYVIGNTLGHTLSPKIHALLGDGCYSAKELSEKDFVNFVASGDWDGLNVTMPYKRKIIECLDGIHPVAEKIGAVNTVVKTGNKKIGYNTDAGGMEYALRKAGISLAGKSVLILGSGGTYRTAEYVAQKQGARLVRSVSRKGDLNYVNCYERKDVQIVINATPVGMYPNVGECVVDLSRFPKLEGVMDCVYNPLRTFFAQDAAQLGVAFASGLNMLAEQARLAHELFCKNAFDIAADDGLTDKIVAKLVKEQTNIVLIGMGGAGKTTIGAALATAMGREFRDTDDEIEKKAGECVEKIIAEKGEPLFREMEKNAVYDVCKKQGVVISCGGGAVMDEENVKLLKSNGFCVLVERKDIALRPLYNTPEKALAVCEERKSVYERVSDARMVNDGSIEDAVMKILRLTANIGKARD